MKVSKSNDLYRDLTTLENLEYSKFETNTISIA